MVEGEGAPELALDAEDAPEDDAPEPLAALPPGRSTPMMPADVAMGPGAAVTLAFTPCSGALAVGWPGFNVPLSASACSQTASQEVLPVSGALIELCGTSVGAGGRVWVGARTRPCPRYSGGWA